MALTRALPDKAVLAVLTDMDDTVVGSSRPLEPGMAEAMDGLTARGLGLAIVSGAALAKMLVQVSAHLAHPHYLVATSGSLAERVSAGADGPQREGLFHHAFSQKDRSEILAALRWLVDAYGLTPDTTEIDQMQDRGSQITLSGLGYGADLQRKRAFDPDGSRRREWVRRLEDRLGAGRFNLRVGGTTSLDITPKGVDKGSGVTQLLARTGWRAQDCLYFGDRFEETGNDHPVLAVMDCVEIRHPSETLALFHELLRRP
jgi:HAD superfamily hydrolase (TIGR01484 family)